MENGFISLDRKIMKWEWYQDANTMRVFIHCLINANWKDGRFMGKEIPRGSFVTSLAKLSDDLSLTIQQTRTALKHLEITGEITSKSTNRYRIISVVKYDEYQQTNRQDNKDINSYPQKEQQAANKQLTTIEQSNNNNSLIDRWDANRPLRIYAQGE